MFRKSQFLKGYRSMPLNDCYDHSKGSLGVKMMEDAGRVHSVQNKMQKNNLF